MNDIERYWSDRERRNTVSLQGTIVAALSDGDYTVKLLHTQLPVRASRGNITVALTVNQVVYLGRTDGSGVTKNTGYVILGAAPSSSKNASNSPPSTGVTTKTSSAVTKITPNPVTIRGGEIIAVVVSGVGFTASTVIAYSTASLTNNVAPVITSTSITLSVLAAEGIAQGDYNLLIDGVTVGPKLFRVSSAPGRLWVLFGNLTVFKINPATPATIGTAAITRTCSSLCGDSATGTIYAIGSNGIAAINAGTLAVTNTAAVWTGPGNDSPSCFASGALWFPDGAGQFIKVNPTTAAVISTVVTPAAAPGAGTARGCIYAGGFVWAFGSTKLIKIDPSTASILATITLADEIQNMAWDGASTLYATNGLAAGKLMKFDMTTLTVTATLTGLTSSFGVAYLGGFVYVGQAGTAVTKHDPSTLAQTATVANAAGARTLAADTLNSRVWDQDFNAVAGERYVTGYSTALALFGTVDIGPSGSGGLNSLIYF